MCKYVFCQDKQSMYYIDDKMFMFVNMQRGIVVYKLGEEKYFGCMIGLYMGQGQLLKIEK